MIKINVCESFANWIKIEFDEQNVSETWPNNSQIELKLNLMNKISKTWPNNSQIKLNLMIKINVSKSFANWIKIEFDDKQNVSETWPNNSQIQPKHAQTQYQHKFRQKFVPKLGIFQQCLLIICTYRAAFAVNDFNNTLVNRWNRIPIDFLVFILLSCV